MGGIIRSVAKDYGKVGNAGKAFARDISHLISLGAITHRQAEDKNVYFKANLNWPSEITETEFFKKVSELPRSKIQYFKIE